jgi:hypothetical protein
MARDRSAARGSAVIVFETLDIVFAEVNAGLNLDQLDRFGARVFQPVHRSDRHECGLVLLQVAYLTLDRHARDPAHHDPMFGTMLVTLQRKLPSGLDDDTFNQ